MQVAVGRADELEQARPFGLLAGAFGCVPGSADPRRAAIAGLLSAPDGRANGRPVTVTSDPGLQFRVVDAFGDLVEALALSGPVVVGADDLQWADPSSLVTLAAMGRRVADLPAGIIGCFRPVPRAAELDGAMRALQAAGARHFTLSPLGTGAVGELVSDMVSAEPGPGLLAEIAGAAGNPLFVTGLLAALRQDGAIQVTGGRAEVADAALPPTLRLTILRRLSFLPQETLQGLQAASILGSAGCTARRHSGWRARERRRCGLPSTSRGGQPRVMARPSSGWPGRPGTRPRDRRRPPPACWAGRSR
jgi:predicted ATPase